MTFVIISAELAAKSTEYNAVATVGLVNGLTRLGVPFTPAIGSYKGRTEKSFLVELGEHGDYDEVRDLAAHYNQESILLVDDQGEASLIYLVGGGVDIIGQWQWAGLDQPETDAWTQLAGQYFYVV